MIKTAMKQNNNTDIVMQALRTPTGWLRSLNIAVLAFFVTTFYAPSALAIKNGIEYQQAIEIAIKSSQVDDYSFMLQSMKAHFSEAERLLDGQLNSVIGKVTDIDAAIESGGSIFQDDNAWREQLGLGIAYWSKLGEAESQITRDFDNTEAWLKERALDAEFISRLDDARSEHAGNKAEFKKYVSRIQKSKTDKETFKDLQRLNVFLSELSFSRAHEKFDEDRIENLLPPPVEQNEIKLSKSDYFRAGHESNPKLLLAALGDFDFSQLKGASDPTYLAKTEEVVLSDIIKSKAQELDYDPIKIQNWVSNNIEWLPTWGAMQTADTVLLAKKGNAQDIASLTISLLRASKIPARYVHGTIQLDAERYLNWVGADTINQATSLALQGGIPTTLLVSGGRASHVKMEHVWVEAAIDYFPSRGAKNRSADSWVALDPSFKQYEEKDEVDFVSIAKIDTDQILANTVSSGQIDDVNSSITGMSDAFVSDGFNQAVANISAYFDSTQDQETLENLLTRNIVQKEYPILPSGLPYQVLVRGADYAVLNDNMKHFLLFEAFDSVFGQSLGSPVLSKKVSFSQTSGKRIGITYDAAQESDQQVLDEVKASGRVEIPLYLVNVKGNLNIDGDSLAKTPSVRMGSDQFWNVTFISPGSRAVSRYTQIAGDELVFALDANGITRAEVQDRFDRVAEISAEENLQKIGLQYWHQYTTLSEVFQRANQAHAVRLPSGGMVASPIDVKYSFGIPRLGSYSKRGIDIKRTIDSVAALKSENARTFRQQLGQTGSYLESSIFEQTINGWHGTGTSSMQVLIDASRQDIPIYQIDSSNRARVLPKLQISDADVLADIRNALDIGFIVTVPEKRPETIAKKKHLGYILEDPVTGAASYRISTGLDGGEGETACAEPQSEPLQQSITNQILTFIALALIAVAIAGLLAGTGGGGAVVAPAIARIVTKIMLSLGLSVFTFSASAGGVCTALPVPRNNSGINNEQHNICANSRPGNRYPNQDVCVLGKNGDSKKFDAYNGSILWEVKAYNFANQNDFFRLIQLPKDVGEARKELGIAKSCGMPFHYTVGDPVHAGLITLTGIPDTVELDPVNCLPPKR